MTREAHDIPGKPLAPWWHTVLVLIPLAVCSIASAHQHGLPNAHLPGMSSRLSSYITVLAEEWVGVVLVWLALRRRGLSIGTLVSGRWDTRRAFFKDMGFAIVFLAIAVPLVGVLTSLFHGGTENTIAGVIPKTVLELAVWIPVAASGGFCEELVFRGYLMRQFSAWTRSPVTGVILQGVVFGLAHGYYYRIMIVVMLQGWLLGFFAMWRKSLRPGMLAHGIQDTIGGVIGFLSA